ncbi:helix-turn-helix domain-containing protein [Kordiimonas pumila]|uniref:Helix-turn-helix domain-containing protein n=1 Tax=Kordiimonas pumila TaxID=2161677 RepID=A0ABV7D5V4_9PROT|nr:AraC family transcriptional regulator [Kordiimonas pumila]
MIHAPVHQIPQKYISGREIAADACNGIDLQSSGSVYLVCPQDGVFSAVTRQGNFILSLSEVLLLPAGHCCHLRGSSGIVQVAEISGSIFKDVKNIRVLRASNLIKSLITEVVGVGDSPLDVSYENAIISMLNHNLTQRNVVSDQIPLTMPKDRRLLRVCEELLLEPSLPERMGEWCLKAAMSRRSFTRTFKQETGMTFGAWRREVRLVMAIPRIVRGEQVSSVAYDVGYGNVSAFTVAFKRRFGVPPCHYKPKAGKSLLLKIHSGFKADTFHRALQ